MQSAVASVRSYLYFQHYRLPFAIQRSARSLRNMRGSRSVQKAKVASQSRSSLDSYSLNSYLRTGTVFVHIPKTGGLAVARALYKNRGFGHRPLQYYRHRVSHREWQSFFKFAVVRNPFTRIESAFHFLKQGGLDENDARVASALLDDVSTFEDFVLTWLTPIRRYSIIHFVPQVDFLIRPHSSPKLDYLGYFERLPLDFDAIAKRVGSETDLEVVNKTRRKPRFDWSSNNGQLVAKKLARLYRRDFEALGYSKNPLRPNPTGRLQRVALSAADC